MDKRTYCLINGLMLVSRIRLNVVVCQFREQDMTGYPKLVLLQNSLA